MNKTNTYLSGIIVFGVVLSIGLILTSQILSYNDNIKEVPITYLNASSQEVLLVILEQEVLFTPAPTQMCTPYTPAYSDSGIPYFKMEENN